MTLHLPLKERWFRMIQSEEKREEYREITPYWMKRLMNCYSSDRTECVEGGCARLMEGKKSCRQSCLEMAKQINAKVVNMTPRADMLAAA